MGGTIHVRPAAERGTVFTVSLPRTEQTTPQIVPRDEPVAAHIPGNILVVDDDGTVRQVICRMIESEGFTAEQASGAQEALDLLAQRPFDLVVTDYGMPHMNGHALAKEIAARGHACPVILLSGWNPGVDCPAESDDLAAVLRKPITINTLTGAISRALSPRQPPGDPDLAGR
jgi:CheY-like chemotaxis protein